MKTLWWLLLAPAFLGCEQPHVPAAPVVDALRLRVRMLPDPGILGGGGFVARFRQEGAVVGTPSDNGLNYVALQNGLVWGSTGGPAGLPTAGLLDVELEGVAADATSTSLQLGGVSDVTRIAEDGATDLPLLVSAWNTAVVHPARLPTPRAAHRSAVRAGRLFLIGGVSSAGGELAPPISIVDLMNDDRCDSDEGGDLCPGDPALVGRADHVALPLWESFGEDCPFRESVVFGLGRDGDDQTLSDLWALQTDRLGTEDALVRLDVTLQGRRGASLAATVDCRLLLIGGAASAGGPPLSGIDVVTLVDSGASVFSTTGPAVPTLGSVVARFPNLGTDDVVAVGGSDENGASLTSAWVSPGSSLDFCNLDTEGTACNGGDAPLACARAAPAAAKLTLPAAPLAQSVAWLIVAGDEDGTCASGPARDEVLRASAEPPFFRYVEAGDTPTVLATAGMTATSVREGRAVIAGGTDAAGLVTAAAELFTLTDVVGSDATTAEGTYTALGSLGTARTHHGAAPFGASIVLSGGFDESGATLDTVEVINLPYRASVP